LHYYENAIGIAFDETYASEDLERIGAFVSYIQSGTI